MYKQLLWSCFIPQHIWDSCQRVETLLAPQYQSLFPFEKWKISKAE